MKRYASEKIYILCCYIFPFQNYSNLFHIDLFTSFFSRHIDPSQQEQDRPICWTTNLKPFQGDTAADEENSSQLERSLCPLWKLTYYGGLLFDWCRPIRLGCASVAIHCITIFFFFTLFLYSTFLMITQLAKTIGNPESNFQQILILLIAFSNFPIVFITWGTYLVCRKKLLFFFHDWGQLEKQDGFSTGRKDDIKRFCNITYGLYFTLGAVFILAFAIVLGMSDPNVNDDLIFHYYPELINTTLALIRYLAVVSVTLSIIFLSMIDIVPLLVYYHIAIAIKEIENEIRNISKQQIVPPLKTEIEVYRIWSRFEKLADMVGRADNLFGPTIIFNHGTCFFTICGSIFSVMNLLKNPQKDSESIPVFFMCLLLFPSRLLFSLFSMLKVHSSASKLLSTLSGFYNTKYYSMDKGDRRVSCALMNRMQNLKLAACPSGFYKITHSTLLTILSLIVSYTVLVIQSN